MTETLGFAPRIAGACTIAGACIEGGAFLPLGWLASYLQSDDMNSAVYLSEGLCA
jgi:hypothetical protein